MFFQIRINFRYSLLSASSAYSDFKISVCGERTFLNLIFMHIFRCEIRSTDKQLGTELSEPNHVVKYACCR